MMEPQSSPDQHHAIEDGDDYLSRLEGSTDVNLPKPEDPALAGPWTYSVTGSAAHARIAPLLPRSWIDVTYQTHGGPTRLASPDHHSTETTTSHVQSSSSSSSFSPVHFLWENAPRYQTRSIRDQVRCYNHLPQGTTPLLDSKWVLARWFSHSSSSTVQVRAHLGPLAVLPAFCFRGPEGFRTLCQQHLFVQEQNSSSTTWAATLDPSIGEKFYDLLWSTSGPGTHQATSRSYTSSSSSSSSSSPPPYHGPRMPRRDGRPNWWVIKDASSNGAGGIWMVGPENYQAMLKQHERHGRQNHLPLDRQENPPTEDHSCETEHPPLLLPHHRYVAQQYAWPPVLYGGRKCHVRVYGLLTSPGRAYVHRRAFLHVANDPFPVQPKAVADDDFCPSVHITNCCANSHDPLKFSGEICADLEGWDEAPSDSSQVTPTPTHDGTPPVVVNLGRFFPSIRASVAALAERAWPFLQGGQANGGFEYLGMDFILSYDEDDHQPLAYLLEVNAPPSQDTATGLPHAEELHNEVMQDLITLWVYPRLVPHCPVRSGGWRCVYDAGPTYQNEMVVPSRAALLNMMKWAMFERKCQAAEARNVLNLASMTEKSYSPKVCWEKEAQDVVTRARSCFPYFSNGPGLAIFLENAGGSQVPQSVIDAVGESMRCRHRSVLGVNSKAVARSTTLTLLGAAVDQYQVFFGPNASTLLQTLAMRYVQSGLLKKDDEIILCSENHLANVTPWLEAAQLVGATVKWWDMTAPKGARGVSTTDLNSLLSCKTRVVALPHASNILGEIIDVGSYRAMIDRKTGGYAHMVVDGVAAAPHSFPAVSELQVTWYVVSFHKLFGPHLGALCGQSTVAKLLCHPQSPDRTLEVGTINYEACEGIKGLAQYLQQLTCMDYPTVTVEPIDSREEDIGDGSDTKCERVESDPRLTVFVPLSEIVVQEAYRLIRLVEGPVAQALRNELCLSRKVSIIEGGSPHVDVRLPLVSFVHSDIRSSEIVERCSKSGIICRHGSFLSTQRLQDRFGLDPTEGVVRISLVHYNTLSEIERVMQVLQSIPGWL